MQFATGSALGSLLPACQRTPKEQRDRLLADLVEEQIVPDTRALLTKSKKLESSLADLVRNSGQTTLLSARAAFRATLLAWEAAACFKGGPILATGSLLRAMFWPTKTSALDALIRSRAPFDRLNELAVDQKGLFAIEHLLFPLEDRETGAEIALISADGERVRWLMCGLARLVRESAQLTCDTLGDGAALRVSLQRGEHESIKLLLNNIGSSVSSVITDPGAVLRNEIEKVPTEVRGGPSRLAFAITESRIAAAQRLYSGESDGSLASLVKRNAPEVHDQVASDFARALKQVRALPEDVAPDRAPAPARLAAAAAVHALEAVVKSDLATALGVPLLFGLPHED